MSLPQPFVRDFSFTSSALAERRGVTVFLPPGHRSRLQYPVLFCADGQAVHGFADRLAQEIDGGRAPPIILIGVHSVEEHRAREYVLGVDAQRFEAHEHYFADEIRRWARSEFALLPGRHSCGVFGFSNGGTFALAMGIRHRDQYGVVIAFSIAGGADRIEAAEYARRPSPRFYLSAGTREKPFRDTGRAIAKLLSKHGVENVSTERCAGHEFGFWNSELPVAIRWSYPEEARLD
jgi:enterochelin esterase-like enzyme